MGNRVVITGLGIISPIGNTIDEFWQNCLLGKSSIENIPEHWFHYADFHSKIWSVLPDIDFSLYEINRLEQKQIDKSGLLALAACRQAITSAHLHPTLNDLKSNTYTIEGINSDRSGVFMGTGIGGLSTVNECLSFQILNTIKNDLLSFSDQKDLGSITEKMILPRRFNPFAVSMIMPNAVTANINIKYGIHGISDTTCSSCASGTTAIGKAFKAIQNNEMEFVIAGGVEYLHDAFGAIFYSFDVIKALTHNYDSRDTANRPFDQGRSGFLFSQGAAGILIMEELNHAQQRGADIIAEIIGYGENCDAHSLMVMDKSEANIRKMLNALFNNAGLKAGDIDYINTHGTGTVANDEIESRIIEDIFGKKVLLNSTKSLIGHTLGASGAVEAIVTALSILHKTTHVCKNLENPLRALNFATEVRSFPIHTAITQSFGFGGHNAALILKEFDE